MLLLSYSRHVKPEATLGQHLEDARGLPYPTWPVNASGLLPREPGRSWGEADGEEAVWTALLPAAAAAAAAL